MDFISPYLYVLRFRQESEYTKLNKDQYSSSLTKTLFNSPLLRFHPDKISPSVLLCHASFFATSNSLSKLLLNASTSVFLPQLSLIDWSISSSDIPIATRT